MYINKAGKRWEYEHALYDWKVKMRHNVKVERLALICFMSVVIVKMMSVVLLVEGEGVCGKLTKEQVAHNLSPCAEAALNKNVKVSKECCDIMNEYNKDCLCSILLSPQAKKHGIDPAIALTIPKRCNLVNRPIGYKCGGYFSFLRFVLFSMLRIIINNIYVNWFFYFHFPLFIHFFFIFLQLIRCLDQDWWYPGWFRIYTRIVIVIICILYQCVEGAIASYVAS